jgi:hypothetical protein
VRSCKLTAWYRQKTQYVLVGLSFFVAAVINVDTIDIARQLSADPNVRGQLVEQGMKAASASDLEALMATEPRDRARKAHEQAVQIRRETEKMFAAACPAGKEDSASTKACTDGRNKMAAVTKDEELKRAELAEQQKALDLRIKERADALSATGLMIGWKNGQFHQWLGGMPSAQWFEKLMGLLLSAFALALGAPFWFNVLKSVASVRSVGPNIVRRRPKCSRIEAQIEALRMPWSAPLPTSSTALEPF